MDLKAYLTFGWQANPEDSFSAARIHQEAESAGGEYKEALAASITKCSLNGHRITGLELLFRRRTDGFGKLKKFIGELLHLPAQENSMNIIVCEIDAFAYAFLKGAKNFDFLLPLAKEPNPEFDAYCRTIHETIDQLKGFERRGRPISSEMKGKYMALRSIVMRKSARDECRSLATLLISGPSTLDDIKYDLGLNYSLSQRTLAVFENCGVVERRNNGTFCIQKTALPVVVFSLREAMGIDLLAAL
jgi:hypothetical protein